VARPRQIACQLGHPFTPANVRINGSGSQECLVCARRRSRQWARRHRASQPIIDDKHPPTVALVVWASQNLHATWTYHHTHADAAAQAPDDGTPYTIVDINRKPWISHHTIGKGTPMTPKELLRLQAAAIAEVGDRPMRPHPGGLAGRITDAHDAGDETLAAALQAAWSAEQ
jgi:hypothetical protein